MKKKVNEYRLIGISPIPVTEKGTGRALLPKGEHTYPMIGLGVDDKGKVKTLCVDEFEDDIYLKKHRNSDPNKTSIVYMDFVGGSCFIPTDNTKMIDMIERWGANKNCKAPVPGAKPFFEFVDTEKIAMEGLKQDDLFTEAKYLIKNCEEKKIIAFADSKGLSVTDNSINELRYLIKSGVKAQDAEKFLNEFKSPKLMVRYNIKVARENEEIIVDTRGRIVVWADSKNEIIGYGDQDPIEALVDYALTPDGKTFYNSIVSGKTSELEVKTAEGKAEKVTSTESVSVSVEDMVKMALEKEVIKPNDKNQHYFGGSNCGSTVEAVTKHIEERPKKVSELKEALGL